MRSSFLGYDSAGRDRTLFCVVVPCSAPSQSHTPLCSTEGFWLKVWNGLDYIFVYWILCLVFKLKQYPVLIIPILIAFISLVFQAADLVPQLRYSRSLIEQGHWWLFVTGNLVHMGWGHLLLNLAGLAMVWWFFIDDLKTWEWLLALLISSLFVTVGLYLFDVHLIWYVGLSGLLHGLFVAGGIRLLSKEFGFAMVLLGVLAGKLAYEQFVGSLPGTSEMSGGPVVVDSHLYGAIGGVVSGLLIWLAGRFGGRE